MHDTPYSVTSSVSATGCDERNSGPMPANCGIDASCSRRKKRPLINISNITLAWSNRRINEVASVSHQMSDVLIYQHKDKFTI